MNTQNLFSIQPSNNVPNAGYQPVRLGIPDPAMMMNDICFVAKGSFEFIPMNSIILREALLSSAEFLKTHLGLEVKPIQPKKKAVVDPEPVKRPSTKVKEVEE